MFGEKDQHISKVAAEEESAQNQEDPEEKRGFSIRGIRFLGESTKMCLDGFASKPQELTLSYLCENPKQKGKEVIVLETSNQGEKWVERDFLSLSETKSNSSSSSSSKREAQGEQEEAEIEREKNKSCREKKPKFESTLNLSLSLPDVSLSVTASNALQTADPLVKPRPSGSMQSLDAAPSNNNTQTTCSNDFTAASLSYSYSHPFSHNPSCSLTRNSTENYEYSVGKNDQTWCGGEGTNGSVHSRFRPIGDGFIALNNSSHGGGGAGAVFSMLQGNRVANKDSCCNNSLHKTTSSDNLSFFPFELPAMPQLDAYSGDSRRRDSENLRGLEGGEGEGITRKISRPERILREIVSQSLPVVAQIIQELPEEALQSTKEYLKNLIVMPEKREELVGLQKCLDRRSDLTKETLSKCPKDQLDILVSVKMGLGRYISGKVQLPANELIEIFLFTRCRNVNCKSVLPVDDCDCKFCSAKQGFCSSCMCPVCMKFDSANNTCSWVGCDVCSHWCHAACGMQKNLIRPGPSLKGPSGTSEVQFHCIGCNHASEMFGFVKDVFVLFAKGWGLETLIKELDCVRKIFKGSEDFKSKELHIMAEELISKLESKAISPSNACNIIIQFFNHADSKLNFPASGISVKELMPTEAKLGKDALSMPPATSIPPKYTTYNANSSGVQHDPPMNDICYNSVKAALLGDLKFDDEFQFEKLPKKDAFDSIESIVRIKEAEARMFQNKADEARREAEGYWQMIRTKSEKLEEEYAEKLAKLRLQETEERRRNKLEELKVLENSHCDYYNMKLRMQSEVKGLLERLEATKQQWV